MRGRWEGGGEECDVEPTEHTCLQKRWVRRRVGEVGSQLSCPRGWGRQFSSRFRSWFSWSMETSDCSSACTPGACSVHQCYRQAAHAYVLVEDSSRNPMRSYEYTPLHIPIDNNFMCLILHHLKFDIYTTFVVHDHHSRLGAFPSTHIHTHTHTHVNTGASIESIVDISAWCQRRYTAVSSSCQHEPIRHLRLGLLD